MDTITLGPPTKDGLATEAQSWASRARGLVISDRESCIHATQFLRSIKGLRGQIQHWFEPHVEAAMETKRKADAARKALVDERDRMEAPLVDAEAIIKRSLLAFEAVEEQKRQDEQRRLQAEADRRAEAIALEAAAALEWDANQMRSPQVAQEMRQEAEDILAQPTEAPIVVVQPTMPKVQGIVYRDNWKAFTTDLRALAGAVGAGTVPANLITPNLTALNQMAKATQGASTVPGVKFFNDRTIAARG